MSLKKILVVDDSKVDLANIEKIVSEAGYTVITANDGAEAIEKAKAETPDLILLDVVMQPMDGYQACRELRNTDSTKNIPVVFVTGKGQKADRMWAKMQGGEGFIQKPFTSQEIIEQINNFS
ncbi:chemotaxis protein CheY [Candidatus Thiomargarita nelsonii]|uniref:Chemotaxis protein CheY n=1 Tax=Candidatus Thiomargarita nelsonii TaxID=1003181 RepID=A0A0A6PDB1_9GAMM|nr:chemotaxis protein CheY [Candidatus Thiomargarita nelsonii]